MKTLGMLLRGILLLLASLFCIAAVMAQTANTVYFADDFENGTSKWVAGTGTWGLITSDFRSGANSISASPNGNYLPNANLILKLAKPIDLSGATKPVLSFWQKYSIATDCCWGSDHGYVEVSNDYGLSWTGVRDFSGDESSWDMEVVDLTPYKSKPVLLRFRLWDDGQNQSWGWLIDDVEIKEAAAPSVDIGLSISPSGSGSISGTGINCTGNCTKIYQYNWDVSGHEWALVNSDYESASHSVSSSPQGNYASTANSTMTLVKPVDLSGAIAPALSFWDKYSIATDCCWGSDHGVVEVSSDSGLTWTNIGDFNGNVSSWTQETKDLTPYKAQPVLIRFRLWDDGQNQSWGWLVDDVVIQDLANSKVYFSDNFESSKSLPDFTDLTLTATPKAGYTFDHWTGCNTVKGNTCTVNRYIDHAVTAIFKTGGPVTPVVTWPAPAAIPYGTPLSGAQLNATFTDPSTKAAVAGTPLYTPPAGTVLAAGPQTLGVSFTPANTTSYTNASGSVQLTVNKVALSVSCGNLSMIYGGTVPTEKATLAGVVNNDGITATCSTTATSNSPVGKYQITATLTDPNTRLANYTVANTSGTLTIGQATPIVTWPAPAAIPYGTALSGTQLNATFTDPSSKAAVPGTPIYTPPAGTVLAAGPQTLKVSFTPTDAKDYTNAPGSVPLTVNKAGLSVSCGNLSMTYGAAVPTEAATLAGVVNNDGITATCSTTATSSSPVGKYQITATLNDPNTRLANYTVTNTPGTLTIGQATPVVTWPAPAAIPYGTALSGAQLNATFTDPSSKASVAGTPIYTPPAGTVLTAGPQTLKVSFTPTDAKDYTNAPGSVPLTVNKAALSVSCGNLSMIYGGTVPTEKATLTGVVNNDGITATCSTTATSTSPVGSYQITATLNDPNTRLANYTVTNTPGTLTIGQATPVVTWPAPAPIPYGTTLSGTQLNATAAFKGANLQGSWKYVPASGAVLTAGMQPLSATFTPTDAVDFTTATISVNLSVAQATPTCNWPKPAPIVAGTALSAAQLNATFSWIVGGKTLVVPGTPNYVPGLGTVLPAGTQTLSVNFSPADSTDYTSASCSVTITVTPNPVATPTFSVAAGSYGTAFLLTITDATPGATIYYMTTGRGADTDITQYTAPILIAKSQTVNAIAVASGLDASSIGTAAYVIGGTPMVLVYPATAVNTSSATLNATVDSEGLSGTYLFQYGTSPTALTNVTTSTPLPASTKPTAIQAALTGLTSKTTYYYQVVVTTPAGTSSSAILSLATQ